MTNKEKLELQTKLIIDLGDWFHLKISEFPKPSFLRGHEATAQANAVLVNGMSRKLALLVLLYRVIETENKEKIDESVKKFRSILK